MSKTPEKELEFMLSVEGIEEFLKEVGVLTREQIIERYAETHRMAAKSLLEYLKLAREAGML